MEHTFTELLWLLLIYSFIGWIIEAAVGTIKNRKFTNRGFSTGPFCLVYGVAAVLMEITLSELIGSPFFLFLGCGIQATFVEWFTGKTLERMNRHKWWDYSDKKWNFDGYICPQYSLLWAVLGIVSIRFATPLFLDVYYQIPEPVSIIIVWVFAVYLLLDMAVSFAAVFHLRNFSRNFFVLWSRSGEFWRSFPLIFSIDWRRGSDTRILRRTICSFLEMRCPPSWTLTAVSTAIGFMMWDGRFCPLP